MVAGAAEVTAAPAEGGPGQAPGARRLILRRVLNNKMVMLGGTIIAAMTLLALLGPLFLAHDPYSVAPVNRLQPPLSEGHLLGTDNYGRDILARVVYGARTSLSIGLAVAVVTAAGGLAVGLYAGYYKWLDAILMRISDGLMAFPAILLAIAIMVSLGPRTQNLVIALPLVFIPYVARAVRSQVLSVKELTFVEALRAQGASGTRILWLNIAPNVLSPLIIQATFVFADSIITEAALSFLGAGVPPPNPSWGNILFDGKVQIYNAWWMTVFPGVAIMLTVLGINVLGDGLRDLFDPHYNKARGRRPAASRGPLSAMLRRSKPARPAFAQPAPATSAERPASEGPAAGDPAAGADRPGGAR